MIYVGVNLPAKQGVSNQRVVDAALASGYDLITARITSAAYRKRVQALYVSAEIDPEVPAPMKDDLVVLPGPHVSNTIAICAPWAELDSKDAKIAKLSYKVLVHELAYAHFCGLPYVVIEGPRRRTHLARYAHSLTKLLRKFPEIKILLHTTFCEDFRDGELPPDLLSTWDVFDGVRKMCDYAPNLSVTLEVQNQRLPEFLVSRWLCEPVKMLILGEQTAFVSNPKNYPVLAKYTQQLVRRFAALEPFLLIKESTMQPSGFNGGAGAAQIYLRNLLSRRHSLASSIGSNPSTASENEAEENTAYESYVDVLEEPLQPLAVPLESSVYEVFESDETKYHQYYLAVLSALSEISTPVRSIAVLGAGRGALVDRVLDAIVARRLENSVIVYAVEKHAGPTAFLHARRSQEPAWECVEIVHADMRSWKPSEGPCQLVVSELLGSFGDNELSPECVGALATDPAVLDQQAGIMIPSSYTSYVAPVYSPVLWSKARGASVKSPGLEQAYVVYLRQGQCLAAAQPCWTFEHTRRIPADPWQRAAKLSFRMSTRATVYGFAGYFAASLYGEITLSTLPASRTHELTSWFPLFFPVREPLEVFPDSQVDINIWRENDGRRCWYEWAVETSFHRMRGTVSTVHNSNGNIQNIQM